MTTAAFVPRLCTGKPQLVKKSPLTVQVHVQAGAELE